MKKFYGLQALVRADNIFVRPAIDYSGIITDFDTVENLLEGILAESTQLVLTESPKQE